MVDRSRKKQITDIPEHVLDYVRLPEECEEGEKPAIRVGSMVLVVVAGTIAAAAGLALALDAWWPYLAAAVAVFIIVKSA